MEKFQSFVGAESTEYTHQFSSELLSDFQRTVRSRDVSPMIWTRLRDGEFELLSQAGIELKQVLHTNQDYDLVETPKAETSYRYKTRLVSVVHKISSSAELHFFAFETNVRTQDEGTVVAIAKSTFVYRELHAEVT